MNSDDITRARDNAQQIINGFRRPNLQAAHDAVRLAELLELRNRQLQAAADRINSGDGKTRTESLDDIFFWRRSGNR